MGDDEVRDLARSVRRLLEWVQGPAGDRDGVDDEVSAVVRGHLDDAARGRSVVGRTWPPFEHVNLQVALDAWCAQDARTTTVHGLAVPEHYGGVGLRAVLHGDGPPAMRLSAPDLVDLPSGPASTVACWRIVLLLVRDARGAYVLLVRGPQHNDEPMLQVEVAGLETPDAQAVLGELADLRAALNVHRGQVLELTRHGIGFPVLPPTAREDVVLPEQVLRRVERHAVDVAARREQLLAAGQHLKRGLLLYGPPGTGKTHTTRYLVQRLAGSTVLMLSGHALRLIATVTSLARELQPAVVVLEDVDLVAQDRGFGPGPSPVLFELLDAMDGAAADSDLLFLLTTNRADLLEPALAARPGRVDVAVEIGLPDDDARRRLFEVYSRGVPLALAPGDLDEVVARTDGVTASFLKELVRRAVLEALTRTPGPLRQVRRQDLSAALDDLLDSTQSVTRALLGVPADQEAAPATRPTDRGHGGHGGAWTSASYTSAMPARYDG